MSSSPSGMAVPVSESAWSWWPGPPSRGGDVTPVMQGPTDDTGEEPLCSCPRIWQKCPCHGCPPAWKGNLDFMFHLSGSDFADICWPLRPDAMSAAYCSVRVTAGCGRPSAVQTRGR